MEKEIARKWLKLGSWAGGLLAVLVAILQDILFSDALQGTWLDAIAADLNRVFSSNLGPDSVLVYIVFALVLVILFFIGRFIGMFFTLFILRFMEFLTSGHDGKG